MTIQTNLAKRHKKRVFLFAAAALLGSHGSALAQTGASTIAQDDASHYATNSYSTGVNAGTGFGGAFTVSGSGGQFVGDSNKNGFNAGPGIDTSGKAFGLFQSETATRRFGSPLSVGQTFAVSFDNGLIETGISQQFQLLDADGKSVVTFSFLGGGQDYLLNGTDTGVKFTDGGLVVSLTLTGPTDYSVTVKRQTDNVIVTLPGKLAAQTTITAFSATNGNSKGGSSNDLFFNDLKITAPAK